jgi:hypothetical protein
MGEDIIDDSRDCFYNTNSPHQYFPGGIWTEIEAPLETSIPILARIGSAIPVGKAIQTLMQGETSNPADLALDDERGVEIFPPRGSSGELVYRTKWYEDDGIAANPDMACYEFSYCTSLVEVLVAFRVVTGSPEFLAWRKLKIILPFGESRSLGFINLEEAKEANLDEIEDVGHDEEGRRVFQISTPFRESDS